MEAKELRIGNLVYLDSIYAKFDDNTSVIIEEGLALPISSIHSDNTIRLQSDDVNHKNYSSGSIGCFHINRVAPIPLTEEWLVKFGFEKPAHTWCGNIFHLSEWDKYPLNWCVAMNKNNAIIVQKLKYVHQLQNLYFALTGEELTIKH